MLEILSSIDWRQPLWLFVAFLPVLLWFILLWQKKQKYNKFADKHLLPWLEVADEESALYFVFSRNSAYFLAWFLFSLALAGPRIPDQSIKNQNESLMDIMLVVDLSHSMQATDIKPSRVRRATLEAYDFISMLNNVRFGIIVYAARPHLYVPLTSDLKALTFYLENLDTLQLPTQGSDASAAIKLAKKELLAIAQDKQQIIVWMTDGDIEEKNISNLESELMTISKDSIDTYILGLGTEEGAAIPTPDGAWLKSEGQAVISKMNQKLLKHLSQLDQMDEKRQVGNSRFSMVTSDNSDWGKLYSEGMVKSVASNKSKDIQQWKELFPWALFPAIALMIIALFPVRLTTKSEPEKIMLVFSMLILTFVLDSVILVSPLYAASSNTKNLYGVSLEQGIEAYKNNEFAKAKHYFINSILNTDGDKQRAIALHNLGNTLFKMKNYASAAALFTDALRYVPDQQQSTTNQKLSIALFIEVKKRRKRKMNKGNFDAPEDLAPLFDLPEQLPFMLSTKAVNLLKASLPKLPKEQLEGFLKDGLKSFDLLQSGDKLTVAKAHQIQQHLDLQQGRLYLMKEKVLNEQHNGLWKRLFEIEEGFPGKLKKPKTISGVRPW